MVSTDPSLLFFWALSTLFFIRALRDDNWLWWILAGVAAGFGMLSKYNMLLFLLSILIYLYSGSKTKPVLYSSKFWSACVIAISIFLPNIIWNLKNGMVSFAHTGDNARGEGVAINSLHMFEFLAAQFGVFGPILFSVLLVILFQIKNRIKHPEERFLLWQILPLFVLILSISLLSRAHANWAAPIYIPATILVVYWMLEENRLKLLKISIGIHIFAAVLFMNFQYLNKIPGISFSAVKTKLSEGKIKDPFIRLKGWQELGDGAKKILSLYPNTNLLTDTRKIHAELLYYTKGFPVTIIKWNPNKKVGDHYDLTANAIETEESYIFVSMADNADQMASYFNKIEKVGNVEVNIYGDGGVNYYFYYLQGFKGFL